MAQPTHHGATCIHLDGQSTCKHEANRIERRWWHWRRIILGIISERGKCRWDERWWDRVGWTCERQLSMKR